MTKKNTKICIRLVAALFALGVSQVANATLLAYDGFVAGTDNAAGEYIANPGTDVSGKYRLLDGQNPVLAGFSGSWNYDLAYYYMDVTPPPSLSYSDGTDSVATSGNAVFRKWTIGNTSRALDNGVLGLGVDGNTRYIGFMLRLDDATALGSVDFTTTEFQPFGRLRIKSDGANFVATGNFASTTLGATDTDTHFFVWKVSFGANDTWELFMDPVLSAENANVAVASGTRPGGGYDPAYINLNRGEGGTGGNGVMFDELRIGTTWADVTTISSGQPPAKTVATDPIDGAFDLMPGNVILKWSANLASTYDIYFGTDATAVENATVPTIYGTSSQQYSPPGLVNDQTYYWRIDAVNSAGTTKGDVWSFSTIAAGTEFSQYLRKTGVWFSPLLQKLISYKIYFHAASGGDSSKATIAYIINTSTPRIGTESNTTILQDFIDDEYPVVVVDYGNDPEAKTPGLELDLLRFSRALYGYQLPASLFSGLSISRHYARCFMVPEGWRIIDSQVFWEHDKHGQNGTVDYLIDVWNTEVVGDYGDDPAYNVGPVTSLSEMTNRSGDPLDFKLRLDIIYPSQPAEDVPVMVFEHTNGHRSPLYYYETPDRPNIIGYAFRGYGYVNLDHDHCPIWRAWYNFDQYTMIKWNGLAVATAGLRYINGHAGQLNFDMDHIGYSGHSRSSYNSMRVASPSYASEAENTYFTMPDGSAYPAGSPEPQPWLEFDAPEVKAVYYSMGWVYSNSQFLQSNGAPSMEVCGTEDTVAGPYRDNFVDAMEQVDIEMLSFYMEGLGHTLPLGVDPILGVDLYDIFCAFLDYHLKPETFNGPVVLYVTPANGKEEFVADNPVTVQFAGKVQTASVLNGSVIKIVRAIDGADVSGTWTVASGDTKFIFTPNGGWSNSTEYRIEVTEALTGQDGRTIHKPWTSVFYFAPSVGSTHDVFFMGGQSNAKVDVAYGIQDTLRMSGQFDEPTVVWNNHGGKAISRWFDGGPREFYDEDLFGQTGMYDQDGQVQGFLEKEINSVGGPHPFHGFFWWQGEADMNLSETYAAKFLGMMNQLATDLGQSIGTGTNEWTYHIALPDVANMSYEDIRNAQMAMVDANPSDGTYFDTRLYPRLAGDDNPHVPQDLDYFIGVDMANQFLAFRGLPPVDLSAVPDSTLVKTDIDQLSRSQFTLLPEYAILNRASAWVPEGVPGASNILRFDNTLTASKIYYLGGTSYTPSTPTGTGGAFSIKGIDYQAPYQTTLEKLPVSLYNTVSIGTGGIDASSATSRLIINVDVETPVPQTWTVASGQSILFNNTSALVDLRNALLTGPGTIDIRAGTVDLGSQPNTALMSFYIGGPDLIFSSASDAGQPSPLGTGTTLRTGSASDASFTYNGVGDASWNRTVNFDAVPAGRNATFQVSQAGVTFTTTGFFGVYDSVDTLNLKLGGAGNLSVEGAGGIKTNGTAVCNLEKIGSGLLKLSGSGNTFNGSFSITSGNVLVDAPASINTSSQVEVGSATTTATLEYSSSVALDRDVTVYPGSTFIYRSDNPYTGVLTVHDGAIVIVDGALDISNLVIPSAALMVLRGDASLPVGMSLINNGTIDISTWNGILPGGFVNNGSIIEASAISIDSLTLSGTLLDISMYGYIGHTYQLQRSLTLQSEDWEDVGSPVEGADAPIPFNASTAGESKVFYRVSVDQ